MTARFVLLLALALVVGCDRHPQHRRTEQAPVPAGSAIVETPTPADAAAPVRPLMWSVDKDGHTTTLFATMHRGVDPGRLPHTVWQALERSRALAVEADLARASTMPVQRTDGGSLRRELSPTQWQTFERVVGIAMAARLATFKPFIAATQVALHGLPETGSIDGAIEARAKAANKPVVYLAELEREFAVLEKWFDVRALKDMLDDLSYVEAVSKELVEAYATGDDVRVAAVWPRERERWIKRGRSAAEFDEQTKDVILDRNASWIAGIERLHAEGGAFIAVGALHLTGPGSIQELLTAKGYKVTRITR